MKWHSAFWLFSFAASEGSRDLPQVLPSAPSLLMARAHTWAPAASIALLTVPYFPASTSVSCNPTSVLSNMLFYLVALACLPRPQGVHGGHTSCTSYWRNTTLKWILAPQSPGKLIIISLTHRSCLLFATPLGTPQLSLQHLLAQSWPAFPSHWWYLKRFNNL